MKFFWYHRNLLSIFSEFIIFIQFSHLKNDIVQVTLEEFLYALQATIESEKSQDMLHIDNVCLR
jgi:hypothetical protein